MTEYRRVTYEDRCQIYAFLQVKLSIRVIASKLKFHKSTIYRELQRNQGRTYSYHSLHAQQQAKVRLRRCRRPHIINGDLAGFIQWRLFEGWSPQQISIRMRLELNHRPCCQTIYNYVHRSRGQFNFCLRRYNKRGFARYTGNKHLIRGANIRQRPKIANQRRRVGDWERDTLFVAKRKKLLVCTDRKSRFTKIAKVQDPTSKGISKLTEKLLKQTGRRVFSITNDNASEFCGATVMNRTVYYCDPLKPQQRGTVENTIGLLRQYFKRSTNYYELTEEQISDVEQAINLRPRKCLDFKTPYEVFYGKSVALAI